MGDTYNGVGLDKGNFYDIFASNCYKSSAVYQEAADVIKEIDRLAAVAMKAGVSADDFSWACASFIDETYESRRDTKLFAETVNGACTFYRELLQKNTERASMIGSSQTALAREDAKKAGLSAETIKERAKASFYDASKLCDSGDQFYCGVRTTLSDIIEDRPYSSMTYSLAGLYLHDTLVDEVAPAFDPSVECHLLPRSTKDLLIVDPSQEPIDNDALLQIQSLIASGKAVYTQTRTEPILPPQRPIYVRCESGGDRSIEVRIDQDGSFSISDAIHVGGFGGYNFVWNYFFEYAPRPEDWTCSRSVIGSLNAQKNGIPVPSDIKKVGTACADLLSEAYEGLPENVVCNSTVSDQYDSVVEYLRVSNEEFPHFGS